MRLVLLLKLTYQWAMHRLGRGSPRPKIFVIGFNKCGTKSLHHFFQENGYLSAHSITSFDKMLGGPPLAKRMQINRQSGRPLLTGFSHYEVYSDMVYLTEKEFIEANGWFIELAEQYPDAFFIFNDRPVEKWISSRLQHEGGPRGSFVMRYAKACGVSTEEAPNRWALEYAAHKDKVLAYFVAHPRFMRFELEKHGPLDLCSFLRDHFQLEPSRWVHRGKSSERRLKYHASS